MQMLTTAAKLHAGMEWRPGLKAAAAQLHAWKAERWPGLSNFSGASTGQYSICVNDFVLC